jgi:hypothetical protein
MNRMLGICIVTVALVLAAPLAGSADERAVHPDVAYALAAEPGGVVLSYTAAEWPDLGMRIDAATSASGVGPQAVGTCATGSICAYSSTGISGTKLSWTTCGSKSTAALAQVGSIANARSSGTLQARQGTTVRASASANAYANVAVAYQASITNVFC